VSIGESFSLVKCRLQLGVIAMAAKAKRKSTPKVAEEAAREVIYPKLRSEFCVGQNAITVEKAKDLLGWKEEGETEKFGDDYVYELKEIFGRKIQLSNNIRNRPIYTGNVESLVQEIMNRQWQFNGEPIIIGQTGLIANGQHSLISVVKAEEERNGKQKNKWQEEWPGPITLEKAITYGIEESDKVFDTMDTCKPRSLADVIYRSPYFRDMKTADRRTCSRLTDSAVRILWFRTGVYEDAWAPRRTHTEAMDFVRRHQTLLKCVKHIWEEDKKGAITKYVRPGLATGLMYLMAASSTEGDSYRLAHPEPSEKSVDLSDYEKASDFWVALAGGNEHMHEVRMALGALHNQDTGGGASIAEIVAVLAKAWSHFRKGETPVESDLTLEYQTDDYGVKHLVEAPIFDGIDFGTPSEVKKVKELKKQAVDKVIKNPKRNGQAKKIIEQRLGGKGPKPKAKPKAKKKGKAADMVAADVEADLEAEAEAHEDEAFGDDD
jgi:hypothetical protein